MSEQEAPAPETSSPPGPSRALIDAREKLGLSQKDVADKLFLTTTFIRYIDDGEFHRIPKPAFIKGYLRSYARLVELSGDDVVAMYEEELQAAEPAPEIKGVTEEQVGTSAITGPVFQTGVFGLIGLLFVVAIIWWVSGDDEPTTTIRVTEPVRQPQPQPGPADFGYVIGDSPAVTTDPDSTNTPVTSMAEENPVEVADDNVEQPASLPAEVSGDPLPGDAPVPLEVTIQRIPDGDRTFVTVDAQGFDQIELRFSDECWVEVTDSISGIIYKDLNKVGDVVTLYGTQPFQVLLGKATGVEMIYNGAPFELEPFITSDQTAKLTISE